MRINFRATCVVAAILCLLSASAALAQTESDTSYVKPMPPAGPPAGQQPMSPRVQEERPTLMDRLYTGGGFGLQFGTVTNISVSPILGFMATEKFWFGTGFIYQYQRGRIYDRFGNRLGAITLQSYGMKFFAQQELFNLEAINLGGKILAHGEYELLNMQYTEQDPSGQSYKTNRVETTPMVGLGYRQSIGGRATADLYVLYNLSNSPYTPYRNPIIRFGFNIPLKG
ncbi:hypothetical protein [Pontibacter beigongshangensis]|uniref:hypothetical protein n=1 Tax=Pontibacter beigongshangensis TaxID=2574733 RepID=UPI00164FB1D3|nr:hypothetical protein [Pontibacter beigongshangensis]